MMGSISAQDFQVCYVSQSYCSPPLLNYIYKSPYQPESQLHSGKKAFTEQGCSSFSSIDLTFLTIHHLRKTPSHHAAATNSCLSLVPSTRCGKTHFLCSTNQRPVQGVPCVLSYESLDRLHLIAAINWTGN